MQKEIRILQANQSSGHSARQSAANEIIDNSPYNKELYKLKELLVQRDNEISIFLQANNDIGYIRFAVNSQL